MSSNVSMSPNGRRAIRVVVVDDDPLARAEVWAALASGGEIEVVGEAGGALEAQRELRRLQPDVVVTEFRLPDDWSHAVAWIMREHPKIAIVVRSRFTSERSVMTAIGEGAKAYVAKGSRADHLAGAVREVARGEMWIDPDAARWSIDPVLGDGG